MGQKSAREKYVADEFKALIQTKKESKASPRDYIVKKDGQEIEFLVRITDVSIGKGKEEEEEEEEEEEKRE